jgi:hypothetical protein
MRYLLIAVLLAVGVALVGVIQVVNVPTAQGEVRVNIGVPAPTRATPAKGAGTAHGEAETATIAEVARSHFERDHYRNGYRGGRGYHGDQGHEGHGR